ncbi:MAG: DNA internalization-related competence protein ComEC/Rec2 [Ignavibacteriaceae bacterium]
MKDYPFIKFTLLFVFGILIQRILQPDFILLIIVFIASVLTTLLLKVLIKHKKFQYLHKMSLSFAIISVGLFVAIQNSGEIKSPLSSYYKEKNSTLYGEVKSVELIKSYEVLFTVKTDSMIIDNKTFYNPDYLICKFRGDSAKRVKLYSEIKPGNKIFLTGTFQKGREQRNPGEFDYNAYLSSKGITGLFIAYDTDSISITNAKYDLISSSLFSLRKSIDEIFVNLHDKETSDLLRGLILADRSGIDNETKNAFVNSGVVHVLAVSGLHVGYILIIFIFTFGRFSVFIRSILTIAGLLLFMLLTGGSPSVIRATLMATLIIVAYLSNRSTNLINSICIAGLVILVANPNQLYNPGFQLSFSAVLSIGLIYPYWQKRIYKLKLSRKWIENILLFIGVSLSVQIGTLPFTITYFSKLSVISLFTNLIVIPMVGVILGIGFITVIFGLISYSLAIYFAAANSLLSNFMINFIKLFGNLDISFLWIRNYSFYDSIVFYLLLTFLILATSRMQNILLKISLGILSFATLLIYSSLDDQKLLNDEKLNVLMIDVGQGDSFLIKFPNGKTALIDAGEANPFIDNGERIIIPLLDNLGIDKIDYGFISHLDLDHYGGFVSLIYNNRIKEIYRPLPDSTLKSIRLEKFLKQKKIKTNIYDKSVLNIGNAKIYILNLPRNKFYSNLSSNDKSGVLKIVYGNTSFLFVGDCEHPAEFYLASNFNEILDSDVLKVGHHGSATGSSEYFLNLVSPQISLVSAGIKNKFSHPSDIVINSLQKLNSTIYRTDVSGAVLLQSDGKNINHISWKK